VLLSKSELIDCAWSPTSV